MFSYEIFIMTGLKLTAIFISVLLLDGLVLPAFFGFRENFLSVIALIMTTVYLGLTKNYIFFGLFFSLILESSRGLNFGVLAIPFLFTVLVIFLICRFLNIQYTYSDRFSLSKSALLVLMSVIFVYVFLFFYGRGSVNSEYFNLVIGLTMVLEATALILVFNVVFNKKSDYR